MFSPTQLEIIEQRAIASRDRQADECSVFAEVNANDSGHFDRRTLGVLQFCAGECQRQGSGPLSVYWMAVAYNYAYELHQSGFPPVRDDIARLLAKIEPEQNTGGFRQLPVSLGFANVIPWEHIDRQLDNLMLAWGVMDSYRLFVEFEKVHPGLDGNGRCGALLFNMKEDTMDNPVTPPLVNFAD